MCSCVDIRLVVDGTWACVACNKVWSLATKAEDWLDNPTASSLERAMECPASVVLPAVFVSSDYSDRGTEIHTFVRSVLAGTNRELALSRVSTEYQTTCKGIRFTDLVGDLSNVRAEVAYAIDVEDDTVSMLGLNLGRKYPPLGRSEFAGTNDWEGTRKDGMPVEADLKTGQPVTPCKDNVQQKFHARARQLDTGAAEVEGRIVYVREDGGVWVDSHVFNSFELDSFGDDMAELPVRIDEARRVYAETGTVTVNSGDWCKYCAAMQVCPKFTALARTMALDVADVHQRLAILTPEQQGIAWQKVTAISTLVDEVKDGLKAIARQSPIPLPDGRKEVRVAASHHTSFSTKDAIELLREKGATEAEIAALSRTTPTTPIRAVNIQGATKPRKRRAA